MKVKQLGANKTEITFDNGVTVFFSYETPVACFEPGKGFSKTDQFFSVTTSKHINQYLSGKTAIEKPQHYFENIVTR